MIRWLGYRRKKKKEKRRKSRKRGGKMIKKVGDNRNIKVLDTYLCCLSAFRADGFFKMSRTTVLVESVTALSVFVRAAPSFGVVARAISIPI